jgi:F-type H+-transporting ATPase subunit b
MHIDWWTLALQTVNVLVLIWILARFFFRPVADIVARRQEEIGKRLADAETARKAAADERAKAEAARTEARAAQEKALVEAQKSAQAERAKLLDQASQEITKLRSESEAMVARDRAAAEQQIIDHASMLSIDIARRLLERLPSSLTWQAFFATLCQAVDDLTPEARNSFAAAATTGQPIEVVSATPLTDPEIQGVRDALKKAFGVKLPLAFRSDLSLLGGIELRGHNVILRNSWRADLERIREELSREQHSGQS